MAKCWKIEIDDTRYKIIDYTVQPDEKSINGILAEINDYFQIYKIKGINISDDVKPGPVKILLLMQKNNIVHLTNQTTIYHKMEDEKGVYENLWDLKT